MEKKEAGKRPLPFFIWGEWSGMKMRKVYCLVTCKVMCYNRTVSTGKPVKRFRVMGDLYAPK